MCQWNPYTNDQQPSMFSIKCLCTLKEKEKMLLDIQFTHKLICVITLAKGCRELRKWQAIEFYNQTFGLYQTFLAWNANWFDFYSHRLLTETPTHTINWCQIVSLSTKEVTLHFLVDDDTIHQCQENLNWKFYYKAQNKLSFLSQAGSSMEDL